MDNFIERIERGQFWKFHGGIHPPEQKFLTNTKPIRNLPMPEKLIIPLQQHIGNAGKVIVNIGDTVLKGQPLTHSNHPMGVPIHAPTSGTITDIAPSTIAHPSAMKELCVFLTPDGEDKWLKRTVCEDFHQLSSHEIMQKVVNAGIAGMGGAGFPTHIKINNQANISTLIINAAECEPYITADDLLMREHVASILDGINILDKLLTPTHILIGIEDNKPEAISALQNITAKHNKIKVCIIPTIYPSGGEKQLIKILTGKEVPSGVLPAHLGLSVQNVATCYAIADAVINDTPLIKRVVTISGQGLENPQNVWALLGTPVQHLLNYCGFTPAPTQQLIMGGPMMGYTLPSMQVPVVKTTNCILAPSAQEMPIEQKEVECIRCGQCAEVCPAQLLPQELQWSAKAKDQEQLKALNLFDCIECGACAYVCPSQIPLVHYYRVSKAEIRQQQLADVKAEHAKARFEARKVRLEKQKREREEKHRKAAEARKARMNAGTPQANNEKSAVAAALARVKAKKQQTAETPATEVSEVSDQKSQVSAAIARAKAKKLAAQKAQETVNTEKAENTPAQASATNTDAPATAPAKDKKSAVAAAIAKAKAKKLAAEKAAKDDSESASKPQVESKEIENTAPEIKATAPAKNDKKSAVAAAIAKAKAKKLAKAAQENDGEADNSVSEETRQVSEDTSAKQSKPEQKKPAKAKTDEVPSEVEVLEVEASELESSAPKPVQESDSKKAAIARAIAKAKAKKLAEKAESEKQDKPTSTEPSEDENNSLGGGLTKEAPTAENAKKARIAAAVAKAKAKKLAAKKQQQEQQEEST